MQGGKPVILPNASGEILTPSAVGIDEEDRFLVGQAARVRASRYPQNTALSFKRDMGTDRVYHLGDRQMSPHELSALVLRALKADAEAVLGREVQEAVVTVPAYFGDRQRQATKDAGAIAGFKVERIINEPTAAALAYGLQNKDRECRVVVLDLGGGTFDVTVLEIIKGVIEIQSSAGDSRLGGEDFVSALAAQVEQRLQQELGVELTGQEVSRARILEACELAKRRLSMSPVVQVALPALEVDRKKTLDVAHEFTRQQAEEIWAPLLERIRAPVIRALRDAAVEPELVDEVLLVGGATRMPCVSKLAAQVFGRMPLQHLPPDEAVAMGAAVQAALKSSDAEVEDMVVTDVAPFTLGISMATELGRQRISGIFAPILERGTVIPASRVQSFATIEDSQREILVEVYQGEHSLCRDNTRLGEYTVRKLPPAPAGQQGIDVRFTYDLNGILEVEISLHNTERTEHLVIEQRPGKLSAEQIKRSRKEMEKLKFHPKDGLPNRIALDRAEALYVELTGPSRGELGEAIASFRAILEQQDPKAIDEFREHLVVLIDSLSRIG
jgi:molecular chaperone HscC